MNANKLNILQLHILHLFLITNTKMI